MLVALALVCLAILERVACLLAVSVRIVRWICDKVGLVDDIVRVMDGLVVNRMICENVLSQVSSVGDELSDADNG